MSGAYVWGLCHNLTISPILKTNKIQSGWKEGHFRNTSDLNLDGWTTSRCRNCPISIKTYPGRSRYSHIPSGRLFIKPKTIFILGSREKRLERLASFVQNLYQVKCPMMAYTVTIMGIVSCASSPGTPLSTFQPSSGIQFPLTNSAAVLLYSRIQIFVMFRALWN